MHIVLTSYWGDDTPLGIQKEYARQLTQLNGRLREITPGSGAYFNEADPNEPNWQNTFFGANYARLKQIKDRVDPQGLFMCLHCVGSEDWSKDMSCPRR